MKTKTKNTYHQLIHSALFYIQANLDSDLSMDNLAERAHFSPIHFHRIFKGMIGETFVEHVRRIRLERAALRLVMKTTTVTDAAFDAGYEAVESFSRSFKKMFGCSPSKYQARYLKQWHKKIPGNVHYFPSDSRSNLAITYDMETDMNVNIDTIPDIRVAFVRHIGPYNECAPAWKTLCDWAGMLGLLNENTKFIGVSYDDPQVTPPEKIRYDACITIDESVQGDGEIGTQTIAGGEYGILIHNGPYENLEKTYAEFMGVWLPQSGRHFGDNPSYEVYLNDPDITPPEELLTEIHIPLA